MLRLAHEAHQGMVKTKQRIRELYWWPGIDREVEELVRTCETCSAADKTASPRHAPMQPVPFPTEPWAKLGLDFIGPMAGGRPGQRFAIVAIDYHSKWIEVGFCAHPTTEVVVQFLEKLASREGYPEEVVSDCGSAFTSDHFAHYLRSVGIKHIPVTPYHPQASGQVERANKLVKTALQTASLEKVDWSAYLQMFLLNYRATLQATTGHSPAELLHGRRMRTKLHVAAERQETTPEQARSRRELLARVQGKQLKQKLYFDKNKHVKVPQFKVGDRVKRRLPQRQRKGRKKFSSPLYVQRVNGPASYVLTDGSRVHAEVLVPCWERRRSRRCGPSDRAGRGRLDGSTESCSDPVFQVPDDGVAVPARATADGELAAAADGVPVADDGVATPSPARPLSRDETPGGASDSRTAAVPLSPVMTRSGRVVRPPDRLGI